MKKNTFSSELLRVMISFTLLMADTFTKMSSNLTPKNLLGIKDNFSHCVWQAMISRHRRTLQYLQNCIK